MLHLLSLSIPSSTIDYIAPLLQVIPLTSTYNNKIKHKNNNNTLHCMYLCSKDPSVPAI
jgi:hypothetical protein